MGIVPFEGGGTGKHGPPGGPPSFFRAAGWLAGWFARLLPIAETDG
jgi:hypothetical protein